MVKAPEKCRWKSVTIGETSQGQREVDKRALRQLRRFIK